MSRDVLIKVTDSQARFIQQAVEDSLTEVSLREAQVGTRARRAVDRARAEALMPRTNAYYDALAAARKMPAFTAWQYDARQ